MKATQKIEIGLYIIVAILSFSSIGLSINSAINASSYVVKYDYNDPICEQKEDGTIEILYKPITQ